MVQCDRWLHTVFDASIDEIVVMIDSQLIDGSATERQDARPRQREAVDLDSLGGQAGDVFFVKIVVLP